MAVLSDFSLSSPLAPLHPSFQVRLTCSPSRLADCKFFSRMILDMVRCLCELVKYMTDC
ncbi:uncharacterized protein J3R85_010321 [Psidium guajava]|nr:uncharacterized protein J3R85_010321 [Psidium guajava]